MPTEATINVEALLAPCSGGDPRGDKNAFARQRNDLETLQGKVDPSTGALSTPNYTKLILVCTEGLERGKDLNFLPFLTLALAKEHRFAGIRDGLKLIRLLFDECWERLHPVVAKDDDEDIDPETAELLRQTGEGDKRTAIVNTLGVDDSVYALPINIRLAPLIAYGDTWISWQAWKDGGIDLQAALDATEPDTVDALRQDVAEALHELELLEASIAARWKTLPLPPRNQVRSASGLQPEDDESYAQTVDKWARDKVKLDRVRESLEGVRDRIKTAGGDAPATIENGVTAPSPKAGPPQTAATRSGIYQQIKELAKKLKDLEPHSPVPMLLMRACDLDKLDFHQLVEELSRDQKPLDFLKAPEPIPEL